MCNVPMLNLKFVQHVSAHTPHSIKQFIVDTYDNFISQRTYTLLGIHATVGNYHNFLGNCAHKLIIRNRLFEHATYDLIKNLTNFSEL